DDDDDFDSDDPSSVSSQPQSPLRRRAAPAVPSLVVTYAPASGARLLSVGAIAAALRDEFARLGVSSRPPLVAPLATGDDDDDDGGGGGDTDVDASTPRCF